MTPLDCAIEAKADKHGIKSLLIMFTGSPWRGQHFPQKSGAYRMNKGSFYLSSDATKKLKTLTDYFMAAVMKSGKGVISLMFGKTPTRILILLPDKHTTCDEHNYPKSICDWLEDLGIITNDRFARVTCEWEDRAGLHTGATTILIQREEDCAELSLNYLQDLLKIPYAKTRKTNDDSNVNGHARRFTLVRSDTDS